METLSCGSEGSMGLGPLQQGVWFQLCSSGPRLSSFAHHYVALSNPLEHFWNNGSAK